MPGSTTNLGLVLPITSDAVSELRVSITDNANAMDVYSLLTAVKANSTSADVTWGQSIIAAPSTTQTLPSATANAMVAITANGSVTGATPVTVAGSNIIGVGLAGASSFKLGTPGASVVLQSDGTNWYVVGGQQDTGWVALTLVHATHSGGYVPSARLQGDVVRLKGNANTVTTASGWATLPLSSMYPGSTILQIPIANDGGFDALTISTGGSLSQTSTGSADLDGVTFSIS